jgi:DNA-directed RNA polymerase subunit RPC12/RpoP
MESLMNQCINCGKKVSFGDIVKAGLPHLISCGQCNSKLKFNINKYVEYPIIILLLLVTMWFAYLTGTYFIDSDILPFRRSSIMFGSFISCALILELVFAGWLLKFKKVVE